MPLGGIESCLETVCFNVLSEIVKCVRWMDLIPKGVPSIVLIASHGPCKGNIFICLTFAAPVCVLIVFEVLVAVVQSI